MATAEDPPREQPNRLLMQRTEQIIKNQAKILRSHLNKIEIFMMTSWMLNFVLAYKDSSSGMDQHIPSISFTFRTWIVVDGAFNLVGLIPIVILSVLIQKWKIQNLTQARTQFFFFYRMCGVLLLLKSIWIFVGSFMFLSFDYDQTTDLLSEFVTVYFVGFYGGLLYLIHFYIKKRMYRYFNSEYEQREGRPLFSRRIIASDLQDDQRTREQRYKQLVRKKIQKFSYTMITVVPIFNIAFYVKDQSECMDYWVFGNAHMVYRRWNLMQFLLLLLTVLFYNLVNLFEGLNELRLNQYQIHLKVVAGIYISLIVLDISVFIYGMVIFLNLNFATCSNKLLQFSVYYFLAGVNLIVYLIIIPLKQKYVMSSSQPTN